MRLSGLQRISVISVTSRLFPSNRAEVGDAEEVLIPLVFFDKYTVRYPNDLKRDKTSCGLQHFGSDNWVVAEAK